MAVTSLVAVVAPCTGIIIKNVFGSVKKLLQNGILLFVFRTKSIARNRVTKLEFMQTKNRLF